MLSLVQTDDYILAACEWCLCDKDGTRNKEGKYLWIANLEIAKSWRNEFIIKEVIKEIDKKAGDATHVYFSRTKHNKRISVYPREKLVSFARREELSVK